MIGAEIGELQALSGNFDRQSATVDGLLRDLRTQLASTYWRGPRAERFRASWSDEYEPALVRLSQALHEAASHVRNQADQLIQVGG
jgi:WXG100 family type VII secretion target